MKTLKEKGSVCSLAVLQQSKSQVNRNQETVLMASVQLFNEHLELLATIARNDLQFYCIVHYFDQMHSVYMEIVTSQI